MSMKVAKSIAFLDKLNRFLPEIILETLYTSLIHPYLSYGIEASMKHIKTIPLKYSFS